MVDKSLLFDNITYLLNKTGKKIGEFEKEVGVSVGYISRKALGDGTKVKLDFLLNAARVLGVTVDMLLSIKLSALSTTEEYLLTFMDKLIKDTKDERLIYHWEVETVSYLQNEVKVNENEHCTHPLALATNRTINHDHGYPYVTYDIVWPSKTYDLHSNISGNWLKLELGDKGVLYLTQFTDSECDLTDKCAVAKELWLVTGQDECSENHFLCSNLGRKEIALAIDNLYLTASEAAKAPSIQADARNIIDAFMRDDFSIPF